MLVGNARPQHFRRVCQALLRWVACRALLVYVGGCRFGSLACETVTSRCIGSCHGSWALYRRRFPGLGVVGVGDVTWPCFWERALIFRLGGAVVLAPEVARFPPLGAPCGASRPPARLVHRGGWAVPAHRGGAAALSSAGQRPPACPKASEAPFAGAEEWLPNALEGCAWSRHA